MTDPAAPHGSEAAPQGRYLLVLALTALGVVYGDIGTSPLYALRECFHGPNEVAATPANVLGVLSLVVWALVIVISVKYLVFILRADNDGEGGILALTALATPSKTAPSPRRRAVILLGLFGAALLYGDGMITPAISVLSAVEGLEVATPFFSPYVIPITVVVLVGLFVLQRRGTGGIGLLFGPVMLVWFAVLAVLGVAQIIHHPEVLTAVNPYYGAVFFAHNGAEGFFVLGSVFLVATGAETLYADIGHFGARPIRLTWFAFVFPALLLNYFGQGALLLGNPLLVENPFYRLAPAWALYPLVILATVATVIASQAVISGAFSLTKQAVQLGYSPRLDIEHTSARERGQIYIPMVNWVLMAACIALVLGFRSSSNLAAAYGVGVTTDMVFTTTLFAVVARRVWGWPVAGVVTLAGLFFVMDLSFWGANLPKIPDGGWFPLVVAGLVFTVMSTWQRGRQLLGERFREQALPVELLLDDVRKNPPPRVPGTAVFMHSSADMTPPALLHNLKHNHVLHERVVLLHVETEEVPHVREPERAEASALGEGFYRVLLRYGFMDSPDIPEALSALRADGLEFRPMETTYFLGRERLLATERHGMARWRERLFVWVSRNARPATAYFCLPPNRVVELGAQIEL